MASEGGLHLHRAAAWFALASSPGADKASREKARRIVEARSPKVTKMVRAKFRSTPLRSRGKAGGAARTTARS